MRCSSYLIILSALFVLQGRAESRQSEVEKPFFFIQLSDTHVGTDMDDASFSFAIAAINHLKPAFVVVSGDLIDSGGDIREASNYHHLLAGVSRDIPVYDVAGNHDVSQDGVHPTERLVKFYRSGFGADYYSFRYRSLYGIVLDSTIISDPKDVEGEYEAQDIWLQEELSKAKASGAQHVVIFQHHPYFLSTLDEADQYYNLPSPRRQQYVKRLVNAGVRYVFAGHTHRASVARQDGLEVIVDGSVSGAIPDGRSGFLVAVVRPDGIEHQFYSFGRLPGKIDTSKPLKVE